MIKPNVLITYMHLIIILKQWLVSEGNMYKERTTAGFEWKTTKDGYYIKEAGLDLFNIFGHYNIPKLSLVLFQSNKLH